MTTNSQIISQLDTEITVSSVDFLKLPDLLRPDFNIFAPFDVNSLFSTLEMVVPRYDEDSGDHLTPDQNQETVGTYNRDLWRGVYTTSVMSELAEKTSRYSPDTSATPAEKLKILMEKIICELFLGQQLGDPAVFGDADASGLTLKTDEYIKPWLNGDTFTIPTGDTWGRKCFAAEQFDTITTQLVAAGKFTRELDGNTETTHGKVNLATGDSIGVRVKLIENPDNFLYVNFYLQQSTALFNITLTTTLWSEMSVYEIFNHDAGESLEYDSTLPIEYTNFTSAQLAFSNTLNDGISGLDSTDNFQFTPSAINIRSNIGDVWGIRIPQGALRTITGVQCAEVNFTVTFIA